MTLTKDLKPVLFIALGIWALAADLLEEQAGLTPVERLLIHTSVLLNSPTKRSCRDKSP